MAIDFSLLKAPQGPSVVANLPMVQNQNGLASFGQGLMSGLDQASQMNARNQQVAASQQAMDQSKQLFPLQKADLEASTQAKQMQLKAALNQTQAFAQSFDKGMQYLQQADPKTFVDIQKTQADTQNALAQAAEHMGNTKKQSLDIYNAQAIAVGSLAASAATGKTPEEKQAMYDQGRKFLPETVQALIPATFNQGTHLGLLKLGNDAQQQHLTMLAQDQKNLDPLTKNQNQRDLLVAQKNKLIHEGKDTANVDKRLNETQTRIDSLSQGQGQNAFSHENVLRDEVNKQSIPFQQVNDAYGRIQASGKNPTAAGDLALIFNYMKMLDPGSTVREGEFATAQNSGSAWDLIGAKYNKILSGERLAPTQRSDFLDRSKQLYKSQEQVYQKTIDNYTEIAKRNNLDPRNVIQDVRIKGRGTDETPSISPDAARQELIRRGIIKE